MHSISIAGLCLWAGVPKCDVKGRGDAHGHEADGYLHLPKVGRLHHGSLDQMGHVHGNQAVEAQESRELQRPQCQEKGILKDFYHRGGPVSLDLDQGQSQSWQQMAASWI